MDELIVPDGVGIDGVFVVADEVPPAPEVYFVIMDRGGIFGAYFDAMLALDIAQNIKGVVVTLPIAADFRER